MELELRSHEVTKIHDEGTHWWTHSPHRALSWSTEFNRPHCSASSSSGATASKSQQEIPSKTEAEHQLLKEEVTFVKRERSRSRSRGRKTKDWEKEQDEEHDKTDGTKRVTHHTRTLLHSPNSGTVGDISCRRRWHETRCVGTSTTSARHPLVRGLASVQGVAFLRMG